MIDYETKVYDSVRDAVKTEFPEVDMASEYVRKPGKFPHVTLWESENIAYRRSQDSSSLEHHVSCDYELNVYSNLRNGKKSQARAILAIADREMLHLGFSRVFTHPVPNAEDTTVYRILARYRGVIDENGDIATR